MPPGFREAQPASSSRRMFRGTAVSIAEKKVGGRAGGADVPVARHGGAGLCPAGPADAGHAAPDGGIPSDRAGQRRNFRRHHGFVGEAQRLPEPDERRLVGGCSRRQHIRHALRENRGVRCDGGPRVPEPLWGSYRRIRQCAGPRCGGEARLDRAEQKTSCPQTNRKVECTCSLSEYC